MPSFPFKKIDAFATPTSSGNPAGAVFLESFQSIDPAQMQRIARELARDAFRIRYFSSEKEVQFCGHATIGILYDLVANDPALAALPRILLHTNKGILPVENRLPEESAIYIHAPLPVFTDARMDLDEVARALNLPVSAVDPALQLGIVNAGNQTLCVPLNTVADVVGARPDFDALLAFCLRHQLDVITIFSGDPADPARPLRTRVFAAPFGYLEDPATGSGNAALGYHLHRIGRWDGSPIRIEQNADLANPNLVRLASVPDPTHGIRTIFGGGAITRIEGRYCL